MLRLLQPVSRGVRIADACVRGYPHASAHADPQLFSIYDICGCLKQLSWWMQICSVKCYWHCSDDAVHYKSDEMVNFCDFGCATTSPITVL